MIWVQSKGPNLLKKYFKHDKFSLYCCRRTIDSWLVASMFSCVTPLSSIRGSKAVSWEATENFVEFSDMTKLLCLHFLFCTFYLFSMNRTIQPSQVVYGTWIWLMYSDMRPACASVCASLLRRWRCSVTVLYTPVPLQFKVSIFQKS